jgi:hypothetical protein
VISLERSTLADEQGEQAERPRLVLRVPRGEWSPETLAAAVAQLAPLFAVQLQEEPQLTEPLFGHVAIDLFLDELATLPAATWTAAVETVLEQCFWRSPRGTPTELTLAFWNSARRRVAQARLLAENATQIARALALLPDLLNERARDVLLAFDPRLSAWRQD